MESLLSICRLNFLCLKFTFFHEIRKYEVIKSKAHNCLFQACPKETVIILDECVFTLLKEQISWDNIWTTDELNYLLTLWLHIEIEASNIACSPR